MILYVKGTKKITLLVEQVGPLILTQCVPALNGQGNSGGARPKSEVSHQSILRGKKRGVGRQEQATNTLHICIHEVSHYKTLVIENLLQEGLPNFVDLMLGIIKQPQWPGRPGRVTFTRPWGGGILVPFERTRGRLL